jgi:hypothetical protein
MTSTQYHSGVGFQKQEDVLNLNRLVELALNSSPRVGVVNFNILKTFLIELLKALNLQSFEPKFDDENDASTKAVLQNAITAENQQDKLLKLINLNDKSETNKEDGGGEEGKDGETNKEGDANNNNKENLSTKGIAILTSDMKPLTLERFHNLEDKVSKFEKQIAAFDSLPTNKQIIDKSNNGSTGPILEIWQYTQLSKRLESNEEGITKLTSLLQDLIGN